MRATPFISVILAVWAMGCTAEFDSDDLSQDEELVDEDPADKFISCNKPRAAGTTNHTMISGGVTRRFLLNVPPGYNGRSKLPVLFDLHGSGSFPEQELVISQTRAHADARNVAVVAPEALGGAWNVPVDPLKADDVAFISGVIDQVANLMCIDRSRVYVTGFSGGGRMASLLACELSNEIAAIAPVGGVRFPGYCGDEVPVVTFHGTVDPINPYNGGGPAYWGASVEDAVDDWGAHDDCYVGPVSASAGASVTSISYDNCDDYTRVVLYRIDGMGHQWPGSPVDIGQATFGPPSNAINATATMLDFLLAHRR